MLRFTRLSVLSLALLLVPSTGHGQAGLLGGLGGNAGYGANGQCLSPNDDGSSRAIDLTPFFPGGLRFFDRTHTQAYLNTNGNITFSGRVSQFTPDAFPVADQPMIAPFWADVDIRRTGGACMGSVGVTCSVCEPCHNPGENGVWWYGEPGRMVFTWDRVGRYNCANDKRNSFQLILTAVEGCGGAGDFDVEFRYNRCEWEAGSASGDSNSDGLCGGSELFCTPAQAGFDAGNSSDFVSIMGSRMPGIHTRLCTMSNVGEPGVWRFEIRSGAVICPGAGEACSTGLEGVCGQGRMNCVGSGTECVQDVTASEERCDALDNDCDGLVDEEPDSLCPDGQICETGTCLASCFEFGCPSGQSCTPSGRCADAGCEDVTCPEGERCRAGACVGACDGVVCPGGLSCRAGLCVDLCEGLSCDDCTVCVDGTCAPRCQFSSCPSGESCQADGRCVESACASVECASGEVCRGGACIDACDGAVCPEGSECSMGECVPVRAPDAGPPSLDAGIRPQPDAGSTPVDGGAGMVDAGRGGPPPHGGVECLCRAAGLPQGGSVPLLLTAALFGLVFWRRRAR